MKMTALTSAPCEIALIKTTSETPRTTLQTDTTLRAAPLRLPQSRRIATRKIDDDYNKIVKGGIRPQVNQTMLNIQNILKKHNATMDDVVKCTCILANGDDWGPMSEEYVKYFKSHKPARTTFGGAESGDGILVEIECIANLK